MEQNQNKNKGVAADCSTSSDDVERYFNSLPVGYRFAPSDDELIRYYLLRKINNEHLPPNRIHVVDLYNYSPQQLAETYKLNRERESQWYFFTSREKKYPKGSRPKRNARELGYWKATGTDKAILDGKKPLGFRKSLDYYEERQRDGTKTNWKMHEYLLHQSLVPSGATARGKNPLQPKQDEWVLCKIYNNKAEGKKNKNDKDGGTVNAETEIPLHSLYCVIIL
ncbi:NAC transcription factor 29 [Manihot esculenta]|uniref:NAC domain-containing protein n=1 Tax=Manihot esculenta TaxID=3983 RepID=A0A199UBM9_MANES|nr:NAC transcription factor 29 [Manihot esculenta]